MNLKGLGLTTSALVTLKDQGDPGIPYHIMLRALLGAYNPIEAIKLMNAGIRSSSANYLIAHRDGLAIDMETIPGGWSEIFYIQPDSNRTIIHTNHFLEPSIRQLDISFGWIPSTLLRLQSAQEKLRTTEG
jgi:isopenicillin-N N-acyltransferase-like protein